MRQDLLDEPSAFPAINTGIPVPITAIYTGIILHYRYASLWYA